MFVDNAITLLYNKPYSRVIYMNFSDVDVTTYDKYTFGKCIRTQREEMGISLRTAACKIGISAAYLSDIEKGKRYAPISKDNKIFNKLLYVLDIPLEQRKYIIDMAYVTRGCPTDILDYLSDNSIAREFIRQASAMKLTDEDWSYLLDILNQTFSKQKKI